MPCHSTRTHRQKLILNLSFLLFNYRPQLFLFQRPNVERSLSFVSLLKFLSCLKQFKTSVFPLKGQVIGPLFRYILIRDYLFFSILFLFSLIDFQSNSYFHRVAFLNIILLSFNELSFIAFLLLTSAL